jgi:trans-aconitate 2-methyltransferase
VTWDPAQYGRFGSQRQRAAVELLAAVRLDDPELVHDIGCGRGEMARAMADRWPSARVVGSDLSEQMLAAARAGGGRVEWQRVDLAVWEPEPIHDLLYANAVLHWLDNHAEVLPRLAGGVRQHGVFAIQMPQSWPQPSHVTFREVLAETTPDRTDLHARFARNWVHPADTYRELLLPFFEEIDIWETTYHQVLDGPDPVLQFVKGSLLTAVVEELTEDEYAAFEETYRHALRNAYPRNSDGTTTFPFSRLFVVASKKRS